MKKIIAGLLTVLLLGVMLPGCQKEEPRTFRVAVMLPDSASYFSATRVGCREAAEKYHMEITFFDAGWNVSQQLIQMKHAIADGCDIIALCACDAEVILPGIAAAKRVGVPVLLLTNGVGMDSSGMTDGVVAYVGQDEIATGRLCAEIAKKLLGEKGGKVAMLEGKGGTFCQIYRQQGFLEGIQDSDIEVVFTRIADWDKDKAMRITEDLIASDIEFNLIFCQDDRMAAGAGQALAEAGIKDQVYVVGLGGSIEGMKAMQNGLIDGDTFLSAKQEGFTAIETCYRYLNGEHPERRTVLKQVEVTPDQVSDYTPEW